MEIADIPRRAFLSFVIGECIDDVQNVDEIRHLACGSPWRSGNGRVPGADYVPRHVSRRERVLGPERFPRELNRRHLLSPHRHLPQSAREAHVCFGDTKLTIMS